jgi:hypothetical protein
LGLTPTARSLWSQDHRLALVETFRRLPPTVVDKEGCLGNSGVWRPRQDRLLPTAATWPRNCRTAKKLDEIEPLHVRSERDALQ